MGWGLLMMLLALAEYSVCHDVDASCVLLRFQGLDSDIQARFTSESLSLNIE